jgi:uncharacterized cupredoxin-like copper-binding protein
MMTRTARTDRPTSHRTPRHIAASDIIPTIVVVVITVWAAATRNTAVAVPGAVIAVAMIAVTVTPGVTLAALARRIRGLR